MASHRILVVGLPSALSRELLAYGHIVRHAPMSRDLWTDVVSGVWDACVFEAEQLCAEVYDLIQRARETQPNLALLVAAEDDAAALDARLLSGADDWLKAKSADRPSARILTQAVASRRRCADVVHQHPGSSTDTELAPSQPAAITSPAVPRLRKSRRLRVLLIDDEPLVLRSLRRMLSEHHIDTAQSGAEALELLQRKQDYDLIFCDLMMPEMDGTVVHAELERRMPALLGRLVFCSGGAVTARTKQFVEQSKRPLVDKPLTRASFDRVVSEQLAPRRLRVAGDN
jgi:CheY-like chemotaxis protein